jgi:hypothetical protein
MAASIKSPYAMTLRILHQSSSQAKRGRSAGEGETSASISASTRRA